MENRRTIVPLKFSDGEAVKNLDGLKKKFADSHKDILKFIVGGELERFFYGHWKDDLKKLVEDGEKDGIPPAEIAGKLAAAMGVAFEGPAADSSDKGIVSPGADLKAIISEMDEELHFPAGQWNSTSPILIKAGWQISGSSANKTILSISEIDMDMPDNAMFEMENLAFRKDGKGEAVIKVSSGQAVFRNISFEGIRLEAHNKADVKMENCSFVSVSNAILLKDYAVVDIGEKTRFEKVETPILIKTNSSNFPLKEIGKAGRAVDFKFHKGSLDALLENEYLKFLDYMKIAKHLKKSGEIILKELLIVDGERFTIEGDGKLVIKSDLKQAIVVKNKGSLNLKNIELQYTGAKAEPDATVKEEDKIAFLHAEESRLNLIASAFMNCNSAGLKIVSSNAAILGCKIINNGSNGISIRGGTAKITDCEISKNGKEGVNYPQIYIADKSEVIIENTTVSDSKGGSGIYTEGSNAAMLKCKVINNGHRGIWIDAGTAKITDCEISKNGKEGEPFAQIYIADKSEVVIENTTVSDSRSGSGIYTWSDNLIHESINLLISRCKLLNNNQWGIYLGNVQTRAQINDCEFKNNASGYLGVYEGVFNRPTVKEERNKIL